MAARGSGDLGATNGSAGAGGAGIVGSGLTVINSGTVTGGLSGDGVTRANAITFTGGTNILELRPGLSITGNVVETLWRSAAAAARASTSRRSGEARCTEVSAYSRRPEPAPGR